VTWGMMWPVVESIWVKLAEGLVDFVVWWEWVFGVEEIHCFGIRSFPAGGDTGFGVVDWIWSGRVHEIEWYMAHRLPECVDAPF
jgi:hypothetical protein